MPSYLRRTISGRITKPNASSPPNLNRANSAPVKHSDVTTPAVIQRSQTTLSTEPNGLSRVHEDGSTVTFLPQQSVHNVSSAITYITTSMFDELPNRSGMNSSAVSNVLNYQKRLPKLLTSTHLHALLKDTFQAERDLKQMQISSRLLKLKLVNRVSDFNSLSEILITKSELVAIFAQQEMPYTIQQRLFAILSHGSPLSALAKHEVDILTKKGFIVSTGLSTSAIKAVHNITSLTRSDSMSERTISRAASGSSEAIGGQAAFESLGGTSGTGRACPSPAASHDLMLSVPGIAAYLQLLVSARTHLLGLLRKHGGKDRQMPVALLRERYNGNVEDCTEGSISSLKRSRNEFGGILPSRTKKWKLLYGLRFQWILEECLGAGLVEIWDTGAVGLGVRALS